MPQRVIAATTIIVTIAFLITMKTWIMNFLGGLETRIFRYVKIVTLKANKKIKEELKKEILDILREEKNG